MSNTLSIKNDHPDSNVKNPDYVDKTLEKRKEINISTSNITDETAHKTEFENHSSQALMNLQPDHSTTNTIDLETFSSRRDEKNNSNIDDPFLEEIFSCYICKT